VLLDQSIAAGIGNVYRSEVLFLGGVHPKAPLASLSDRTVERLFRRARALMQANLGPGRRVTVPRRGPGAPRLWVYKRRHRPCLRCGSTIERLALGDEARAVYFCPSCQPLASRSVLAPRTEGRRSSSRDATAGDGRVSSPTGAATAVGPGADGRADREP
jgi:endonuclease-8